MGWVVTGNGVLSEKGVGWPEMELADWKMF